jgi:type II secretory pathway pseudopilin PulG
MKRNVIRTFTLIEVIISIVILSVAIFMFSVALSNSKKAVDINKTSVAAQNFVFDIAKRLGSLPYNKIVELSEKYKAEGAGEGDSGDLTMPETASLTVDETDPDIKNYDITPLIDAGIYRITITPIDGEKIKYDSSGNALYDSSGKPITESAEIGKKIEVSVIVAPNNVALSSYTIQEKAVVYKFLE